MSNWVNEFGIVLSVEHAPKGGTTIGGKKFKGGQFVSSEKSEGEERKDTKDEVIKEENFGEWNRYGIRSKKDLEKLLGLEKIPGAKIENYEYDHNRNINIELSHPHVKKWFRRLRLTGEHNEREIYNDDLFLKDDAPPGLGLQIFTAQVEGATEANFDYIYTYAAGDYDSALAKWTNGYYTWAVFGYDCPLNELTHEEVTKMAKQMFPKARKLSDIINSPTVPNLSERQAEEIRRKAAAIDEKLGRPVKDRTVITGADWWLVKGRGFNGTFSLAENSRSKRQLEAYIKKKKVSSAKSQ